MDSSAWDERYSGNDLAWSSTPNQWVGQLAAELPPGCVPGLAGGEGRNALCLADRGWQATVTASRRGGCGPGSCTGLGAVR